MVTFFAAYCLFAFQLSTLALPTALPPPQSLSLIENQASSPNLTLQYPSNSLPPDPYIYRVPATSITLKFYHYGDSLRDPIATQLALTAAYQDAALHPSHAPISARKLQYSRKYLHIVDVVLLPDPGIDWHIWRLATLGLMTFMQMWDNVWLSFDVEMVGVRGRVGTGYLFRNFEV